MASLLIRGQGSGYGTGYGTGYGVGGQECEGGGVGGGRGPEGGEFLRGYEILFRVLLSLNKKKNSYLAIDS